MASTAASAPGSPTEIPAGGGAKREYVGAGREPRESERDGEFFRAQPVPPVEFALQNRDGGVASAEYGDADAGEQAGDGGEPGLSHRSYCSKRQTDLPVRPKAGAACRRRLSFDQISVKPAP